MTPPTGGLQATIGLLQWADGLFPSGGFAHSLGLEALAAEGRVVDREGLEAFLAAQLEGSAGPCDAVAVAAAVRAAARGELGPCLEVDARLDAMKWVPTARAASRQMGRQTARVAAAVEDDALLSALARAIDAGETPGHHAVAFGAAAGRLRVVPEVAAAAYLQSTASLLVGAALRLVRLGQLEGQRALASHRARIARLAARAADTAPEAMWSFAPELELACLRQEALDGRLFRS